MYQDKIMAGYRVLHGLSFSVCEQGLIMLLLKFWCKNVHMTEVMQQEDVNETRNPYAGGE
jgi:hypothetical protein